MAKSTNVLADKPVKYTQFFWMHPDTTRTEHLLKSAAGYWSWKDVTILWNVQAPQTHKRGSQYVHQPTRPHRRVEHRTNPRNHDGL